MGSLALSIDHIGSTAVPGLNAKNVIDVQITVAELSDERIIARLVAAGFVYKAAVNRDQLVCFEGEASHLAKHFFVNRKTVGV